MIEIYETRPTISERIFVVSGIAEVTPERCTVLAEEAMAPSSLDRTAIEAELQVIEGNLPSLREQVARATTGPDRDRLAAELRGLERQRDRPRQAPGPRRNQPLTAAIVFGCRAEHPDRLTAFSRRGSELGQLRLVEPRTPRSACFGADNEAAAEDAQRRLDLVEPRGVAAVEQPRHLRGLPTEAFRQLFLVQAGGAHRAIGFELGGGQCRQCNRGAPVRRRRQRHVLAMGHHAEHDFLKQVFGLSQGFGTILSLRPAVRQIREVDVTMYPPSSAGIRSTGHADAAAVPFIIPISYCKSRIVRPSWRSTPWTSPVFRSPLPVGTWLTRPWPPTLTLTALAAARDDGCAQAAQFAEELAASHIGNYTFAYINCGENPNCVR